MMRQFGQWLMGFESIRMAAESPDYPFAGEESTSPRMRVGLALMVGQLVMGWPLVTLMGALSASTGDGDYLQWGAPLFYGLSWLLLGLAIIVAGKDVYQRSRALNRYLLGRFVRYLLS